jgi:hypothetical protein
MERRPCDALLTRSATKETVQLVVFVHDVLDAIVQVIYILTVRLIDVQLADDAVLFGCPLQCASESSPNSLSTKFFTLVTHDMKWRSASTGPKKLSSLRLLLCISVRVFSLDAPV